VLPIPATAQLLASAQIFPHLTATLQLGAIQFFSHFGAAQFLPPHAPAWLLAALAFLSAVLPAILRWLAIILIAASATSRCSLTLWILVVLVSDA
jgi:hypothetical protein